MDSKRQELIDALYKDLVLGINVAQSGAGYHTKKSAADNAREAERCINENLLLGGEEYQIQIPEEYLTKDIESDVVYIIQKPIQD